MPDPKQEPWFLLCLVIKYAVFFFPHIINMMPHVFSRCTTGTIEKGMLSQLLFAILWPDFEGRQGIDNQMKSIINTVRHFLHLSFSPPFPLLPPLPPKQADLLAKLEKPSLASAKQAN